MSSVTDMSAIQEPTIIIINLYPCSCLKFFTVPERPDGLELESVGPYSLEWKVDTSLNDLNYERLEVSYSPESSQTDSPFDINRCTDGTFTLEGLQPDTEYSVSVTAISGDTRSDVLTRYGFTSKRDSSILKGTVHPDIKWVLIEGEKVEE